MGEKAALSPILIALVITNPSGEARVTRHGYLHSEEAIMRIADGSGVRIDRAAGVLLRWADKEEATRWNASRNEI